MNFRHFTHAVIFSMLLPFLFISVDARFAKNEYPGQRSVIWDVKEKPDIDTLVVIEQAYLQTDRTYYYPGDDIWFKAYLMDAGERLLSGHSKNLHVDLISHSRGIVASRTVRLEDGLGNGDIRLSDSLASGKYIIRAYTNYMRNFGDQRFFSKEIYIIGSDKVKEEASNEAEYFKTGIHLSFFPEGGSLVENVPSVVSFKAVDDQGKGCDVHGGVYSSKGDLVTYFKSEHLGMGSFTLRPRAGLKYYAVFREADSMDYRADLPHSFPEGLTLGTTMDNDGNLVVTVRRNPRRFHSDSDQDLLLRFTSRNEVLKTVLCKIKSPDTYFVIPVDDLPEGIIVLTLMSLDEVPQAERLVFISKQAPAGIHIRTDKPVYDRRDPVTVNLCLPVDSADEVNGNISVAIADKDLMEGAVPNQSNIASWFLLESDVRGTIEDPSYYFDPSNSGRLRDLDLLLRTQGWRDFAWKYNGNYFPPEDGFTVSGRLREFFSDKPIENSRVSFAIFGGDNFLLTTLPADPSGRFRLSGIDFSGEGRLIVTGIGKKGRLQGLLTIDSATYIPPEAPEIRDGLKVVENRVNKMRTWYEISESVKRQYRLSDTVKLGEIKIIAERPRDPQADKVGRSRQMYGHPDNEVIITEEMDSYPNLVEILRGHVAGLIVTGSYPDYHIYIRGAGSINSQRPPLVLVDGGKTSFEELVTMPVSAIDRIDVLKSVSSSGIFGMDAAGGAINLITRAGGWGYIPAEYSRNLRFSGYNVPRIFYSPQHPAGSDPQYGPDLRCTLFWKPDVILKGNDQQILNFYNGDKPATYRISAEGITSSGIPVTGSTEYIVR